MKKKYTSIALILIFSTLYSKAIDKKRVIDDLKNSQYGSTFFMSHPESDFKKVMNFLDNPVCNFGKIKSIKNLFEYIEIFDRYSQEKYSGNESVFYTFLERHFNGINRMKANILNLLMLLANGMYGEYLSEKYSLLFNISPKIFIKSLKKSNWKRIIDRLDAGNWEEFRHGVEKLGNSDFELAFKKYVFAPRDEKGNRLQE